MTANLEKELKEAKKKLASRKPETNPLVSASLIGVGAIGGKVADIGIKKGLALIPGVDLSDSIIALNIAKSGIGLAVALKSKSPYFKYPALGILAQGLTGLAEPLVNFIFEKLNLGSLTPSVSANDVSLEAPGTDYIPWLK